MEERAHIINSVQLKAKAWNALRLVAYRSKCASYLRQASQVNLVRKALTEWSSLMNPMQIKGRILHKRLLNVFRLKHFFEKVKEFSAQEASHRACT